MSSIGEKIKKCRTEKKMSLRELATRVELSASFLSQIEQGKASPSIENFKKIANALDAKVSYLIEDDEEHESVVVMKKEDIRFVESKDSNIRMAILTSMNPEKTMEPILYHIGIGGESGRDFYSHEGEEFVYIIEGKLEVNIESKIYVLEKGDSMYFKSNQKHKFKNNSKEEVKAVWVVSPPTF